MSITRYFDPKLTEELRLQTGAVRAQKIKRSEAYKRSYCEWKNSELFTYTISSLRKGYEKNFFADNDKEVQISRDAASPKIHFNNLTNIHRTQPSFIVDHFVEQILRMPNLEIHKSEHWRKLIPEYGIELCERYLIREKLPLYIKYLPSRWIKADTLVLEMVVVQDHKVNLSLRLFPSSPVSPFCALDALMEKFFSSN
jgi:hypothetical protein